VQEGMRRAVLTGADGIAVLREWADGAGLLCLNIPLRCGRMLALGISWPDRHIMHSVVGGWRLASWSTRRRFRSRTSTPCWPKVVLRRAAFALLGRPPCRAAGDLSILASLSPPSLCKRAGQSLFVPPDALFLAMWRRTCSPASLVPIPGRSWLIGTKHQGPSRVKVTGPQPVRIAPRATHVSVLVRHAVGCSRYLLAAGHDHLLRVQSCGCESFNR